MINNIQLLFEKYKKQDDFVSFFENIYKDNIVNDYINYLLVKIKEGESIGDPHILYENEDLLVYISKLSFESKDVLPTNKTEKYIMLLQGEANMNFKLYEFNDFNNSQEVFRKDLILKLVVEDVFVENKVLHLKKFNNLFCPLNNCQGIFISIEFKNESEYTWFFNRETLMPIYYDFNSKNHKKLEAAIELLSEIGNIESIEPLIRLTFHENHTIRWKSLNVLINIDFEKGIECLKRMVNDIHPEIRIAAKSSLNRILSSSN